MACHSARDPSSSEQQGCPSLLRRQAADGSGGAAEEGLEVEHGGGKVGLEMRGGGDDVGWGGRCACCGGLINGT